MDEAAKELARRAAARIDATLVPEVDRVIMMGGAASAEGSFALGRAEKLAIASLIVALAQLAVDIWPAHNGPPPAAPVCERILRTKIEAQVPATIKDAVRDQIIRIVTEEIIRGCPMP